MALYRNGDAVFCQAMGRPKEHGEETRERLLEAAARILTEEGAQAVTIRRVADEVGTTTRAIYSLFGGREGLFSALYRRVAGTFAELSEAVPTSDDPVRELVPLGLAYRAAALREPNLYGLLFEGGVPGFTPSQEDCAHSLRSLYRVHDAVRRCLEQGRFPGRDAWDVTRELHALAHGLASLELHGMLGTRDEAERAWRDALPAFVASLARPAEPA